MGILRLLILILLIVACIVIFKRVKAYVKTPLKSKPTKVETTRKCDFCGVYASVDTGILENGQFFCSESHQLAHQKKDNAE